MSDHKPNNPQSGEDMNALYDLLNRLEKRDEVRRYQAFTNPRPTELITVEEESKRPTPARFQPNNLSEIDSGVLLLTDTDEFAEEEPVTPPAVAEKPTRIQQDEALPERPHAHRNPFKALWVGFCGNLPRKEDSTGTKVRKYGFLTSLLVMLLAVVYLVVDLVIIPAQNEKLKEELIELYHPEKSQTVISKEEAEQGNYPRDMLASFVDLYNRNNEVRGWITYKSTAKKDFLNIEYPIVYSGDNEKYLRTDFDGDSNRNGTLFFDGRNCVDSATDKNRALIIYGHNMASGQMFAGLNKLLGNVNNARTAATFTMSTLFREDQYKVFAVVLIDESDNNERSYNMWRTEFFNDADFESQIDEIRKRSLFDYDKVVDVNADDQILVLSTCTGKSSAHVKDGRLLVVARRVRKGESDTVDTSKIVKNNDVIMPYYWYVNQNKVPHSYYLDNGLGNGTETTTAQSSQGGTMHTGYLPRPSTSTTVGGGVTGTVGTGSTESTSSTTIGSSSSTSATTKPSTSTSTSTSTRPTTPTACQHEYTSKVLKEPTCADYGEIKYTCVKCQYSYTEYPMPIAHEFSGGCGSKCKNCDVHLLHEWDTGTIKKQPSCDQAGEIVYICTVCGEEHNDRSAHNAGNTDPVDIRKEPCDESGEAWYKCQDCGELFLKDMFPIGYHADHDGDGRCDGCGEYVQE